jgi:hypothetical protein
MDRAEEKKILAPEANPRRIHVGREGSEVPKAAVA